MSDHRQQRQHQCYHNFHYDVNIEDFLAIDDHEQSHNEESSGNDQDYDGNEACANTTTTSSSSPLSPLSKALHEGTKAGQLAAHMASWRDGHDLGATKGIEMGMELGFAQGLLQAARDYHRHLMIQIVNNGKERADGDSFGEEENDQPVSTTRTQQQHRSIHHANRLQRSLQELDRALQDFPSATDLFDKAYHDNNINNDGNDDTTPDAIVAPRAMTMDVRSKLQRIRARTKMLAVQLGIPYHSLKHIMDEAAMVDGNAQQQQQDNVEVDTATAYSQFSPGHGKEQSYSNVNKLGDGASHEW